MAYRITIDDDDANAIGFSAGRYGWSDWLFTQGITEAGTHDLAEHEAWDFMDAVREDDYALPLLSPTSNLYAEIRRLESKIV